MKPSLSTKDYHCLELVLEAISRIEEYTSIFNSADEFNADYRGFDATLMNFVVIGEMVGKLSEEFKNSNSDVEWQKIKGFRNIVAHDYFGIDAEEVWQIIKNKIPNLKSDINRIISEVEI
jgi:uncharacterized protein with HEPN domain